jgi:hypothetical protein
VLQKVQIVNATKHRRGYVVEKIINGVSHEAEGKKNTDGTDGATQNGHQVEATARVNDPREVKLEVRLKGSTDSSNIGKCCEKNSKGPTEVLHNGMSMDVEMKLGNGQRGSDSLEIYSSRKNDSGMNSAASDAGVAPALGGNFQENVTADLDTGISDITVIKSDTQEPGQPTTSPGTTRRGRAISAPFESEVRKSETSQIHQTNLEIASGIPSSNVTSETVSQQVSTEQASTRRSNRRRTHPQRDIDTNYCDGILITGSNVLDNAETIEALASVPLDMEAEAVEAGQTQEDEMQSSSGFDKKENELAKETQCEKEDEAELSNERSRHRHRQRHEEKSNQHPTEIMTSSNARTAESRPAPSLASAETDNIGLRRDWHHPEKPDDTNEVDNNPVRTGHSEENSAVVDQDSKANPVLQLAEAIVKTVAIVQKQSVVSEVANISLSRPRSATPTRRIIRRLSTDRQASIDVEGEVLKKKEIPTTSIGIAKLNPEIKPKKVTEKRTETMIATSDGKTMNKHAINVKPQVEPSIGIVFQSQEATRHEEATNSISDHVPKIMAVKPARMVQRRVTVATLSDEKPPLFDKPPRRMSSVEARCFCQSC